MPKKKKTSKKAPPKTAKKKKAVKKVAKKKKTAKKTVKATKNPQGNGNSTSFKKGNTAGKGKKTPIAKHRIKLADAFKSAVTEKDMVDIAKALVEKAKKGEAKPAKEVLDRCIGKATQPVEVTGEGGGPIKTRLIIVRTSK